MRLGVTTDTQDMSGAVVAQSPVDADASAVEQVIMGFVGGYDQIPPMYSALKVNGKKLYELAREGREVERQPRHVDIAFIRILDINLPEVRFLVGCSKGTYIRTLCADIGSRLGCGAAMAALKRTRVGNFRIEDAIRLSTVEELMRLNTYESYVMPPDSVFMEYESAVVNRKGENALLNGNKLCPDQLDFAHHTVFQDGDMIRVYDGSRAFKAVYTFVKNEGMFKPFKMFLG